MNEVHVRCHRQQAPPWLNQVEPFLHWVLSFLQLEGWELGVLFASPATSRKLNHQYRGKDYPTDVLSFSHEAIPPMSPLAGGDLLLCLAVILDNARFFAVDFQQELNRTLIHGVLHLAGWEHDEEEPQGPMLELQEKILTQAIIQEEQIYVAVA